MQRTTARAQCPKQGAKQRAKDLEEALNEEWARLMWARPQCHQHTPGVLTQGRTVRYSTFTASRRRRHHFIPISQVRKLRLSKVSNLPKVSLLKVRVRTQIQALHH